MKYATYWDVALWANIVIVSCANNPMMSSISVLLAIIAIVFKYLEERNKGD